MEAVNVIRYIFCSPTRKFYKNKVILTICQGPTKWVALILFKIFNLNRTTLDCLRLQWPT